MGLRIKKAQLRARPLKHLRVVALLMLNERRAARINRDRHNLRFCQTQGPDDVAVLLAQGMAEDAQAVAVAQ